jgi:F420-dependent oxidoreductase-like protein
MFHAVETSAPVSVDRVTGVKLALNLSYWGMGNDDENIALALAADQLGFAAVWVAEAYGSDAPTVLSWIGALTHRIDLGSAIMQIPARSPAMTAMTAATLDTLSNGRVRLGIGVSGPQVSEGWHGVRYDKPLARTREYVEIVELALSRKRLRYNGQHYQLPLPDGPGKALTLTVHPIREHIPIYLAAVGPKNLELAGEIADGLLAIFFTDGEYATEQLDQVERGRRKVGKSMSDFDVCASMPVVMGDDPVACADAVRGYAALYLGGMGSRDVNFYNQLACRMGYEEAASEIQNKYLSRDYAGAQAAVPYEFIDSTSLLGNRDRMAERIRAFAAAGVTTLAIMPLGVSLEHRIDTLRTVAAAFEAAGVA